MIDDRLRQTTEGNSSDALSQDEYFNRMQQMAKKKQDALNAATDTELNAYIKYANQQRNDAMLNANKQKAGLYQAYELQKQRDAELYANAGLGGAPNRAPRSGAAETSSLMRELALQNDIAGVNSEERSALKSLQDMINQEKQTASAKKLQYEADYMDTAMAIAEKSEDRRKSAAASFLEYSSDATSVEQLKTVAAILGVDNKTYGDIMKAWAKEQLAAGNKNITNEDVKSIFGENSEEYKTASEQVQKITNDSLKKEYANLANSGENVNAWLNNKLADDKLSMETKQSLLMEHTKRSINSGAINSKDKYLEYQSQILNDKTLTVDQKNELLDELKKSDYNPKSFKSGAFVIKKGDVQFKFVKENGKDKKYDNFEPSQDFKVVVDGKTYWLQGGTREHSQSLKKPLGKFKNIDLSKIEPNSFFMAEDGNLYYFEKRNKYNVYAVNNVSKKKREKAGCGDRNAFIEALQSKSKDYDNTKATWGYSSPSATGGGATSGGGAGGNRLSAKSIAQY
nr:MAG TPA: hypothetical protein [Caudoviricetes sp.]